jgi:hypothetical protein
MIASVVRVTTKANHQIISNWLKRSTRTASQWLKPKNQSLSATGMPHRDGVLQIQALLRAAAARTIDELWEAIRLALGAFTPSECQNYFAAAGYNAT